MVMKKCPICTAKNKDDAEFCISCGGPLRNVEPVDDGKSEKVRTGEKGINNQMAIKQRYRNILARTGVILCCFVVTLYTVFSIIRATSGDPGKTGLRLSVDSVESSDNKTLDRSEDASELISLTDFSEDNIGGESSEDEKSMLINKASEQYGDIIDRYRYGIENGWTNTMNISPIIFNNSELSLYDVGFAVIDINQDGTDELVIALVSEAEKSGKIGDIYGFDGSKPVWIMSSNDWGECYLHEDGDLYASYDNTFGITRYLLSLEENEIKRERSMILSYNGGSYYYDHDKMISDHGYMESGISTTTEEEYNRLIKEYDSRVKKFSVISLDNIQASMTAEKNERLFMTKYLDPLYADVLDDVAARNISDMTGDELRTVRNNYLWQYGEPGYTLRDIDRDGISELLVGFCGNREENSTVECKGAGIAIYTIKSSSETGDYLVTLLGESWGQHFFLYTGNVIEFTGYERWFEYYDSLVAGDDDSYFIETGEQRIDIEYYPLSEYMSFKSSGRSAVD